jgi:hypothetical protein
MNWLVYLLMALVMPAVQPVVQQRIQQRLQRTQALVQQQPSQPQPQVVFHEGRWWKYDQGQWWVWSPTPAAESASYGVRGSR